MEEITFVGRDEWERVLALQNRRWEESNRTVEAFRRKFTKMHSCKAPTGDPCISPQIRRARQLRERIVQELETATADVDESPLRFELSDDVQQTAQASKKNQSDRHEDLEN